MNEPNSVVGDILQLVLLAGQKFEKQADGTSRWRNVLDPGDIKHVALTGIAAVPTVAPAALSVYLFNYAVPAPSCLLVNYTSLYTSVSDDSSLTVNYGIAYDVDVRWIQYRSGVNTPETPYKESATILNSPCFLMFPGGCTASLQVPYPRTGAFPDLGIYLHGRANAYLMDQSMYSRLVRFQTMFPNLENSPS